jgi:Na+/H+ antiporter NhaD/arsenite permease-like protein
MIFTMSEFVAANTWSMVLLIGNPTNIIVGLAVGISFIDYFKVMILPSMVGSLLIILLFYALHHSQLVADQVPDEEFRMGVVEAGTGSAEESQTDETDGVINNGNDLKKETQLQSEVALMNISSVLGSLILLCCIIFLVALEKIVPMYIVTLIAAIVAFLKDVMIDYLILRSNNKKRSFQFKDTLSFGSLMGVPWKIAPFVFVMFILVEALQSCGLLGAIANGIVSIIHGKDLVSIALIMSLLSSVFCVLLNNQPMSILFAKILLSDQVQCGLTQKEILTCAYAVITGSNLGALLTVNGSLAGLMLEHIAKSKNVTAFTFYQFFRIGTPITLPGIILTSICLGLTLQ